MALEGNLVRRLEEAVRKSIATDVQAARSALDPFFNAKYEVYVVRAKAHAMRRAATKVVRCTRLVGEPSGDKQQFILWEAVMGT